MRGRVFFYVQHLLGIGHVRRAAGIARALVDAGLDVWVVLGGPTVPGVRFEGCVRIPLPPVHATDETFKLLVDERGEPVDEALWEARRSRLLTELAAVAPDVILIEQFPFGRRQFRFELMPLLTAAVAAMPRPAIVSSVRDVLVTKTDPERRQEVLAWVQRWFDAVLVHADPRIIPFAASYPDADALATKLRYTGYVADPRDDSVDAAPDRGAGEILVTVGGGAVGERLLRAAIAARPLTAVADRPWRLICGPNLPRAVTEDLMWSAPPGVIVERWRNDFRILLRNCVLSVSQAGYNTLVDVVAAGARAVVVPFAEGGETEQELRARMFADRGLVTMVDPRSLSGATLATAVNDALSRPPATVAIDLDGAAMTATVIAGLCAGVRQRRGPS